MRRRFILYINNQFQDVNWTGNADDLIKAIWQHNAGTTIGARAPSTVTSIPDDTQVEWTSFVSVQADASLAATVTYNDTGFLNMLDVFHTIEDMSHSSGVYLTAEIVTPTESTLELQTFVSQRGTDRRFSTGSGVLFSNVRGNLENIILTIDAIEEVTMAESLGVELGSFGRSSGTYHDDGRIYDTPFARIETVVDANDAPNDSGLTYVAKSAVQAGWPRVFTNADLTETDQCMRGVHFNFGDYVTVEVRGVQYDMRLNLLDVTINISGETTKVGFFQEQETITF
jgi:hypothetical protein